MTSNLTSDGPSPSQLAWIITRVRMCILLVAAVSMVLFSTLGCEYIPESTFQLASESRLPKWITLPPGLARADASITMSYYIVPWGGRAVFLLRDSEGKRIEKVYGQTACEIFHPKDPRPGFPPGYPSYQEVVVRGTAELIEHRKMEPVFYVTDDPTVWKEFRTTGCR